MASVLHPYGFQHNENSTETGPGNLEITRSAAAETEIAISPVFMNRRSSPSSQVAETSPMDGGVFLTWDDLWVTVSGRRNDEKPILQGLTGYAKPGELLAVMGPSGSGKSTLLDALAGRLSLKMRQTGEILINGQKQTLAYGASAYVAQDDVLTTTLTVGEAVNYAAQLQLPDSMSASEKKERADATIREMGLQSAINTPIGGWGVRGISGGQKRRVSICVEILTRSKLLFLDEPTSGLDSAASYYVMNGIAGLDQRDGDRRTIVASIHQPSSEVFQLFDSLCLLCAGKTVYLGPASGANEFFASSGFPCPTLQNPSDHFLKTINKDFEQDIEQGIDGAVPRVQDAIDTLTKSYRASVTYRQVRTEVAEICKQDCGAVEKKRSHASFLTQCLVLTRRSFKNMNRDLGYYWLRIAIYILVALGLGTIYYDIGTNYGSIQARGSLIMFIASFLTFMAIGGFPSFVEDMKVFERERLNGHYGATSFVIGNTLSSQPYLFLVSVIPGALAYFLSGLRKDHEHFLYFVSVLYASMILVESLMMIVASIVPNFLMGIITGAGIQGLMILGGGFFRLPRDLPVVFWRYPLYYVAFHRYAYQGMFKNEFDGLSFPNEEGGGRAIITGEEILRDKWEVDMSYSKWVDLAVLLGMVVFYRVLFLVIVKTSEIFKSMISAAFAMVRNKRQRI
ncbi:ABC transporter G family member 11 [Morus notabilis]|uniref:ABC transporter G family member 11 n=1 Tax=Morus notabilis TaxID=981085 RepID=UPI000CECEA36|nr:ABC transporter G family member 11 [Morus notabilis]